VPRYLIETYLARSAAATATRDATRARFEQSIYIPEDEICFFVFEAASARAAARAARRVGLDPMRVVEAITSGREEP